MTPRALTLLDRFRRRNRAPAWMPWLGDAPMAAALAAAWLLGTALLGHLVQTSRALHEPLGVAVLSLMMAYAGLRTARFIVVRGARHLFRDWIAVLPLARSDTLAHWRWHSAKRTAGALAMGAAASHAAGWIGGLPLAQRLAASTAFAAVLLGTTAIGLRHAPAMRAAGPSRDDRRLDRLVAAAEPRRLRRIGLWQLRRRWRRIDIALLAAAALIASVFAGLLAAAKQSPLPILAVAVLVGAATFNKTLEGALLVSPVVITLPLSKVQRLLAAAKMPALLALLATLASCLPGFVSAGGQAAPTLAGLALAAAAWIWLMLARTAACVRHPHGGTAAELSYLGLLAVAGVLVQGAGPWALVPSIAVTLLVLRQGIERLP